MSEKKQNLFQKANSQPDNQPGFPLTHRAGSAGAFVGQDLLVMNHHEKGERKHSTKKVVKNGLSKATANRKSSGEKASVKAHAVIEKYERKVHDCYEKQIKKLELTYKGIFQALESHRCDQVSKLRNLQEAQREVINKTKTKLDEALHLRRHSKQKTTPRGTQIPAQPHSPGAIQEPFQDALAAMDKQIRANHLAERYGKPSAKMKNAMIEGEPGQATSIAVSKTQLIRQFTSQAWNSLQFVTFRQQKVGLGALGSRTTVKSAETVAAAAELENNQADVGSISSFLEQLDNCIRLMSAEEWDQRRKQKKREKQSVNKPTIVNSIEPLRDGQLVSKLGVLSPTARQGLPSSQKVPFLLRNDPLSDSEKKGMINHEVALQTGCFGEDDISMIRASQPTAGIVFDQADQMAIRNELKTLSPQCKKEEDAPGQDLIPIQSSANKQKHNLQILGSKHQRKQPVNRRYQQDQCNSVDRTLLSDHSTVTAQGPQQQNLQYAATTGKFEDLMAAQSVNKGLVSQVLTGVQQAESNQFTASQRMTKHHVLASTHSQGSGGQNHHQTHASQPKHKSFGKSQSSQGMYLNTVSSASKVPTVPRKLVKTGSNQSGNGFKGFESQTTEAGTTLMGTTMSTNLRKTSGSDGTGSHNALANTISTQGTSATLGSKMLPVKSHGAIPQSKLKNQSSSQQKASQHTQKQQQFSMSHGQTGSKALQQKHQRSQRQLTTRKPSIPGTAVTASAFGHSHQHAMSHQMATKGGPQESFQQKTWMTQEDKNFFQQLQATTTQETVAKAVRKGSNADEELREMQLRILKEESEEQKSVINPFLGHMRGVSSGLRDPDTSNIL